MLTDAQLQTLAAGLRASADPTVVAALALRDDVTLTNWCNAASTQDAWRADLSARSLFEETNVSKFDNLTAGKRDAWKLMLDFSPIDFSRQRNRNAVVDVWGVADSVAVLQSCTRKATNAEAILGGTSATTNTVTALRLNFTGTLPINTVSTALNRF